MWNRLGRSVNRDENGMKIRVSDTYVKDGREYHGYKIGRVFDVTQTHGKACLLYTSKTQKGLQAKIDKLNDQSRKDDVVTFEELGVDRIDVYKRQPQWYLDNAKYATANILQGHVKDPVMSIYYPINGLLLRYEIMGS